MFVWMFIISISRMFVKFSASQDCIHSAEVATYYQNCLQIMKTWLISSKVIKNLFILSFNIFTISSTYMSIYHISKSQSYLLFVCVL